MPRSNQARAVTYEADLARRIQYERERREITYERMARMMTEAGCPLQPTAIFRIEKGEPRRRITVDEYLAFADVFDVDPVDLLSPPEVARDRELTLLHKELDAEMKQLGPALRRVQALREQIQAKSDCCSEALDDLRRIASTGISTSLW